MSRLSCFTGVILPVFYVRDTSESVRFYRDICGFSVVSYYDTERGEEVETWEREDPSLFVRLRAASQEFGLHLRRDESSGVAGTKHYFEVSDVDQHHREMATRGGHPGKIDDLPWMRLFEVIDPDGHVLVFQTPHSEWLTRPRTGAT
ncbi:VOC family protein [Candidatus Bipolaricaulota bacterium]|nr:VOC family protein [Candidatus Bipolaricaulota bacterium]